MDLAFATVPGALTRLSSDHAEMVRRIGADPNDLCRAAQGLLVAPFEAAAAGLSEDRLAERQIRPAGSLLERALELDGEPSPDRPRSVERRVVGTCRHYAVLATAFLRAAGVPSRARCGFATYFTPSEAVDHWIVEHWTPQEGRWVGVDPEYLDRSTPGAASVHDLRPGEFLTAGDAWLLVRSGAADPADFGVFGTDHWGPAEIRGNVMRDLASVVAKLEMLPWDEWGPMEDSYAGRTDESFDRLVDDVAVALRDQDRPAAEQLYQGLAVPPAMVR